MDISDDDLSKLKCITCSNYLKRGPIYLQHDGAAVCGRCYDPEQSKSATRNIQYETIAKYLRFPCKFRDHGCHEMVPFVNEDDQIPHQDVCEHKQYVCPVVDSSSCDWVGLRKDILEHCKDQHPDRVYSNPATLVHDINRDSLQSYLIRAFNHLFILHTKMCMETGKLFHCVRFMGASDEASKYEFTLDIKRGNEQLTKAGQVAPQGCVVFKESISLSLDTNGLLAVLGGFKGTTFTVTIKRKGNKEGDQLTKNVQVVEKPIKKCSGCESSLQDSRYKDSHIQLCDLCAPKRPCRNQGCTHTDTEQKSEKHEWWFCQQRTQCGICRVEVPPGTLSSHYGSEHQEITYKSGATWRAKRNGRCLVSSPAGTVACEYMLFDSQFVLGVYLPVCSERLKEFRCVVKLTNPKTGHTRTFSPETRYSEQWDWNVMMKKEDFPSWSKEFDVSVDIVRS